MERYYDAIERIRQIPEEKAVPETFRDYFMICAEFILKLNDFLEETKDLDLSVLDFRDDAEGKHWQNRLREWNRILYSEMAEGYETSYLNPEYSEKKLSPFGGILSVLLMEIENLIPSAYEKNMEDITTVLETFIQIYCMFESSCSEYLENHRKSVLPDVQAVKDVLYSYAFDYSYDFINQQMSGQYISGESYTGNIILNHDFKDASEIFLYGSYVSETA